MYHAISPTLLEIKTTITMGRDNKDVLSDRHLSIKLVPNVAEKGVSHGQHN
jgi:hypothetical protein